MEPFIKGIGGSEGLALQKTVSVNQKGATWSSQWKILAVFLVICDTLMLFLALRLSYYIRFQASLAIFQLDVVPSGPTYQRLALILTLVWLVMFVLFGLYNRQNLMGGTREGSLVINASMAVLFLILVAEFLFPALLVARGWLLITWFGVVILTLTGRFFMRQGVRYLRKKGLFLSPALILGANQEGGLLAEQFSRQQFSGLQTLGFVDDALPPSTPVYEQLKVLGSFDDLDRLIEENRVEELILASSAVTQLQLVTIFQKYGVSKRLGLRMSSGLYQMIASGFELAEFASVPLVGIKRLRLTGINWAMKMALDYFLALFAIILLSPIFLLIALLVKIDSPGPIIYRRRVMGINGSQFDAYKFRTMVDGADRILQSQPELKRKFEINHKLQSDPRVTRLGNFLRKSSLDELPQLFNVLRFQMSLVGPRMIAPEEMTKYQQAGMNLLTVKPGITGLWQVSGRSNVTYEERVRMDLYYIRNWSILMDIHLILRTFPAILTRKGAY